MASPLTADRIFHPDCPRLADALAAVEGLADPAEAWEALATDGVIPAAWVGATTRAFADPPAECVIDPVAVPVQGAPMGQGASLQEVRVVTVSGRRLSRTYDSAVLNRRFALGASLGREAACAELGEEIAAMHPAPHPASVAACVTLAADASGMFRAEGLVREVVRRLVPGHPALGRPVVWYVAPRDELLGRWQPNPTILNRYRLIPKESASFDALTAAVEAESPGLTFWAVWAEGARRFWSTLPEANEPNPYEPLVELWASGYCFHAGAYDGIVLGCASL